MRIDLVSRFGQKDTFYVRNTMVPELTDELDRPVLDLLQMRGAYQPPKASDPSWKRITDAFILRPGALPIYWMEFPGTPAYEETLKDFRDALFLLTGKLMVSVTK